MWLATGLPAIGYATDSEWGGLASGWFGLGRGGKPVTLKCIVTRGQLKVNREFMAAMDDPRKTICAFVLGGRIPPERISVLYENKEIPLTHESAAKLDKLAATESR